MEVLLSTPPSQPEACYPDIFAITAAVDAMHVDGKLTPVKNGDTSLLLEGSVGQAGVEHVPLKIGIVRHEPTTQERLPNGTIVYYMDWRGPADTYIANGSVRIETVDIPSSALPQDITRHVRDLHITQAYSAEGTPLSPPFVAVLGAVAAQLAAESPAPQA